MGTLHKDMYQLEGDPTLSPFSERCENENAGWTTDITILNYNDIDIG